MSSLSCASKCLLSSRHCVKIFSLQSDNGQVTAFSIAIRRRKSSQRCIEVHTSTQNQIWLQISYYTDRSFLKGQSMTPSIFSVSGKDRVLNTSLEITIGSKRGTEDCAENVVGTRISTGYTWTAAVWSSNTGTWQLRRFTSSFIYDIGKHFYFSSQVHNMVFQAAEAFYGIPSIKILTLKNLFLLSTKTDHHSFMLPIIRLEYCEILWLKLSASFLRTKTGKWSADTCEFSIGYSVNIYVRTWIVRTLMYFALGTPFRLCRGLSRHLNGKRCSVRAERKYEHSQLKVIAITLLAEDMGRKLSNSRSHFESSIDRFAWHTHVLPKDFVEGDAPRYNTSQHENRSLVVTGLELCGFEEGYKAEDEQLR